MFQANVLLVVLLALSPSSGYPDYFNYEQTSQADFTYGPADWNQVDCRNVANCVSDAIGIPVVFG